MIATVAGYIGFRPLAWSATQVGTPASTAETVLKSYTIPAGMLNQNGVRLRAVFQGAFAANANNKTVRVRLGPVTLTGTAILTTLTAAFNGTQWRIQVDIVRRVVDGQTGFSVWINGGAVAANNTDPEIMGVGNDDDTAMLLELTGQNAVAAADDITCTVHTVEWIAQP